MARKRKGNPVHGWLNLNKPADITSTQCVGVLKRLYNAQKVGHGGTLDPLADGVLPIAFGEATKTSQWAMDGDKEYVFTITWGVSTDSVDAEGRVVSTSDTRPSRDQLDAWLAGYRGTVEQVPPKFSAIKVDGKRAYDLARDGEAFELKSRSVEVYSARVEAMASSDETTIHVHCGKGFYVRALARDIACDLSCDGHITQLTRTRVGDMRLSEATPLEALKAEEDKSALLECLSPLQSMLGEIPRLAINSSEASELRQGRAIVLLPHVMEAWRAAQLDERLALAINGETAIALGDVRAGRFQPSKVFQL